MLNIKSLSLRNFLSYGNVTTVVDFTNFGTTIIKGENLDNTTSGSTSNGVGKTAIFGALSYVLYDRVLTDISKDNLINNINKKDMIVTVDFEKNNKIYHIERGRKLKNKGNYILILENEKDITPDSISNSNELIEKIIGIPHDLFSRIVVFSAVNTSFLDLPVKSSSGPNQTNMIEHLFGLTLLTQKAEVLKEHLKDTQNKIDGEKIHIEHLEKENIRYNEQIIIIKNHITEWDNKQKNEILQLKSLLQKKSSINLVEQEQLFKLIENNSNIIRDLEIKIKEIENVLEHNTKITQQIDTIENRAEEWDENTSENIKKYTKKLIDTSSIDYEEQEKIFEQLQINETLFKNLEISIKESENLLEHNEKIIQQITLSTTRIEEWELNKKEKLNTYNSELNNISSINIEEQKSFIKELNTYKDELQNNTILLYNFNNDIRKLNKDKVTINNNLKHLLDKNCPYCLQEYKDTVQKIKECEELINFYNKSIDEINIKIIEVTKLSEQLKENCNELTNKLIINNIEELLILENKKTTLITKINELTTNKNPHADTLIDLQKLQLSKEDENLIKVDLNKNKTNLYYYGNEITTLKEKLIFKNLEEIIEFKNSSNVLAATIEELIQAKNPHIDSLMDLYKIQLLEEDVELLVNELSINKTNIKTLKDKQNSLKLDLIFNNLEEINVLNNNINILKDKLHNKNQEINPYIITLQELETSKVELVDYTKINNYTKILDHQKFLQKLLTKKDSFVRKLLLEKYLPFLNNRLEKYIQTLGLPYKIEFNSDLTANIKSFNRELEFGNLSHGQKSRVNIGLSLAFRDVLEKLYNKVNILLLDEVLDVGLDSVGVQKSASMLKQKAKEDNINLFIISHRDEICNYFDNIITIQFSDGFSQIKN